MAVLLRHAIDEMNEGTQTPYDELIIKRVMLKAAAGDMRATELIFNYLDGKPGQHIVHEMRGVLAHGKVNSKELKQLVDEFDSRLAQQMIKDHGTDTAEN